MKIPKRPLWIWVLLACMLPLVAVAGVWLFHQPATCKADQELMESGDYLPEFAMYFPNGVRVQGAQCDRGSDLEHKINLGLALLIADEPILWAGKGATVRDGDFTIRVTYLPSFDPPIIVRAEKRGDIVTLFGTTLSGAGGYVLGDVAKTKSVTLTAQQSAEFLDLYGEGLPRRIWTAFDQEMVDGTTVYLETQDSDGYRVLIERGLYYDRLDRVTVYLIESLGWDPYPPRRTVKP